MFDMLRRFDPRNWVEISPDRAQEHQHFGLKGRLLFVLGGLFALSSTSLFIEMTLYDDNLVYRQASYNNVIIYGVSLAIAAGIFLKAWWTRYLAYWMLVVTLSNLFLFADVPEVPSPDNTTGSFFWLMLMLLLLRDLPLCVYLTASRRARMTLEHQQFRYDHAVRVIEGEPVAHRA